MSLTIKDGNNTSQTLASQIVGGEHYPEHITNINKNELGFDAWGKNKVTKDHSLLHGMFTFGVPVDKWREVFNGTQQTFTNATSVDGALSLKSGATSADKTILDTYRNPRYQPNRGHIYSNSVILPTKAAAGKRKFGLFTEEAGTFFSLESGTLYAVVRTTTTVGGTVDDKQPITIPAGVDLEKGNIYDIQFQWRGVGNYGFFINQELVYKFDYLGTLEKMSLWNPALPLAFECENDGADVELICGCVDVSSEGGDVNGKTYGSIQTETESGQVDITGFNAPVIAVRSKLTIGGKRNTRDTLSLLASAYSDQKSLMRVWATRDFTAITEGTQTWKDYGDGHLEYIVLDPTTGTPMTFDTAKANPAVFGSRVGQDESYSTSALFQGRTEIYQTPGDLFVFTVHRENAGAAKVGVTYEFAEEI